MEKQIKCKIDFEKVKDLKDLIKILKLMDLTFVKTEKNSKEFKSIKHLLVDECGTCPNFGPYCHGCSALK